MTKTITATQARKDFFKLLKQAKTPGHFVTITMEGLPSVTMMSTAEWEGWQETMEIMSDRKLVRRLRQAEKDIGDPAKWISLEQVKRELDL
ncbi:MAG: type II toxin-antitoxin system Phd/YefM family antitoxin [Candidatus Peribacteraceae bacterium]|nr:type II toxin-antitoxin system Phd/YefM family antitoxin [Candidatus Peribacteraceae bacterium]